MLVHGKEQIWQHSLAVEKTAEEIARQYQLDAAACRNAALCHDLGGILPAKEMLAQAFALGWYVDPAEEKYPFLLHQRFSAKICEETLRYTDERILSAVCCHTTLKAAPTSYDMALFIADKLAWDQEGLPPYDLPVRKALESSLEEACLVQIEYTLEHEMILMPHRWLKDALQWLRHANGHL